MIDSLRETARARPDLDGVQLPTYQIATEAEAVTAIERIIDYFGGDRTRTAVRLVFADGAVAYLEREDTYAYLPDSDMGFGDSARASLPGLPVSDPQTGASTEYEFRCPVADCPDSPVFLIAFSAPPTCPRHGTTLELVR